MWVILRLHYMVTPRTMPQHVCVCVCVCIKHSTNTLLAKEFSTVWRVTQQRDDRRWQRGICVRHLIYRQNSQLYKQINVHFHALL